MYPITLSKNKDSKLDVYLDNVPALRVPPVVFAGIGNKKVRYARYLDKCFNDNQPLLNTLCELHIHGYKQEGMTLLCHPKVRAFHAICIKEFLEKNDDFLKSLIPYIFPKMELPESLKANEATQNLSDEQKAQFAGMIGSQDEAIPAQVTEEDMAFFKAAIEADQNNMRQTGKSVAVTEASLEQLNTVGFWQETKPLQDCGPNEVTEEVKPRGMGSPTIRIDEPAFQNKD